VPVKGSELREERLKDTEKRKVWAYWREKMFTIIDEDMCPAHAKLIGTAHGCCKNW
jgi:hypothetical protein